MALAIFDLDHTLLSGDSDHTWGQFLVDKKIVDPSHYENHYKRKHRLNSYFFRLATFLGVLLCPDES